MNGKFQLPDDMVLVPSGQLPEPPRTHKPRCLFGGGHYPGKKATKKALEMWVNYFRLHGIPITKTKMTSYYFDIRYSCANTEVYSFWGRNIALFRQTEEALRSAGLSVITTIGISDGEGFATYYTTPYNEEEAEIVRIRGRAFRPNVEPKLAEIAEKLRNAGIPVVDMVSPSKYDDRPGIFYIGKDVVERYTGKTRFTSDEAAKNALEAQIDEFKARGAVILHAQIYNRRVEIEYLLKK